MTDDVFSIETVQVLGRVGPRSPWRGYNRLCYSTGCCLRAALSLGLSLRAIPRSILSASHFLAQDASLATLLPDYSGDASSLRSHALVWAADSLLWVYYPWRWSFIFFFFFFFFCFFFFFAFFFLTLLFSKPQSLASWPQSDSFAAFLFCRP